MNVLSQHSVAFRPLEALHAPAVPLPPLPLPGHLVAKVPMPAAGGPIVPLTTALRVRLGAVGIL